MCTEKCSVCIASALYSTVFTSITCNILLFFPGWNIKYAKEGHLTEEVKYLGGIIGGGVMVLAAAVCFHVIGSIGNRFGMCVSVIFALVGGAGGLYNLTVSLLGLENGPYCRHGNDWIKPFQHRNSSYLYEPQSWAECDEPSNVVKFNMVLFGILAAVGCVQMVLCVLQLINGLVGCMCGNYEEKHPVTE